MDSAKITVTFRHMEHSPVLDEHVRKQLTRLDKFLAHERTPITIDMIIEAKPVHAHHIIELIVKTPHFHKVAKDEGSDLYLVIDGVINTMNNELRRLKERMIDERKDPKKRQIE